MIVAFCESMSGKARKRMSGVWRSRQAIRKVAGEGFKLRPRRGSTAVKHWQGLRQRAHARQAGILSRSGGTHHVRHVARHCCAASRRRGETEEAQSAEAPGNCGDRAACTPPARGPKQAPETAGAGPLHLSLDASIASAHLHFRQTRERPMMRDRCVLGARRRAGWARQMTVLATATRWP